MKIIKTLLVVSFVFCDMSFAVELSSKHLADQLDSKYKSIKTLKCNFEQDYLNKNFEHTVKQSGEVVIKIPAKMIFRYLQPADERKEIISDGKEIVMYYPKDKTYLKLSDFTSEGSVLGLSFLWGKGKISEQFSIISETKEILVVKPKKKNDKIQQVEITVDPKKHIVKRIVIIDKEKNKNDMSFSQCVINQPTNETFKIPEDAHMIKK